MTPTMRALARLLDRCVQEGDCWVWKGGADRYGRIGALGRKWRTHQLAYILLVDDIPGGLQIDHLCRNRLCVNPDHLEAVPQRINLARGFGPWAVNKRKTACLRGHDFTADNTYVNQKGERHCRTCQRAHRAAYKRRKRTTLLVEDVAS